MQAIPNKIVIGELDSPILVFENNTIDSVSEESAVSLIGDELFIDQFVPIVNYHVYVRYAFVPSDYDRFITADGLIMCGHYNFDLRNLPRGTKITFYSNNIVSGEFFCKNVERVGKELYKINAMSAIGLMDRQESKGGIYTGQTFDSVLREIVGEEYEYTIMDDVANLQVYGWLPYSTRRRNLHQLIMAYGVNIVRNDNGGMLFTFLGNTTPQEIPMNRTYHGGKVIYDDPASRVEVVEHAYHYLSSTVEEVLFDNSTSEVVNNSVIIFDMPIYPDSLRVESGSLTISSKGVNYAVVSGVGVLVGKPYVHTTRLLSAENDRADKERIVRVEDATLTTVANSENVLARVAEYYFNATTIETSIVVADEKCGRRYSMLNAFYEYTSGFISKMSTSVSSIRKATCEVITNYIPRGRGATHTNVVILPEASGVWTLPQEVLDKESPTIRVVLIGSGENGANGGDGVAGVASGYGEGGAGGAGGTGGAAGKGGKIYSITIDCKGTAAFDYGRIGANTFFKGGGYDFNSINGASSDTGFLEVFSGTVYALPGQLGQAGAAGGKGGWYPPTGSGTLSEDGEAVSYNGETYMGGRGGSRNKWVARAESNDVYVSGGGGGGAAVGANGGAGQTSTSDYVSGGGAGANGAAAEAAVARYGCGGNGGHGGGGGGGGGHCINYNWLYSKEVGWRVGAGGAGGTGGKGSEGYPGCVIIYY